MEGALDDQNMAVMEWLVARGCPIGAHALAFHLNIDHDGVIVRWLLDHDAPACSDVFPILAARGLLDVMQRLHRRGDCVVNVAESLAAAANGWHRDVARWLVETYM
jgi:hypothetical protein